MSKTPLCKRKLDVGLIWAKYVNTWVQIGTVAGTANLLMMLGVFYTTTLRPALAVPLWLYILVIVVSAVVGVLFAIKVGISGYYRFFSQNSELSETNKRVQESDRKLNLIMEHLGITDTERKLNRLEKRGESKNENQQI